MSLTSEWREEGGGEGDGEEGGGYGGTWFPQGELGSLTRDVYQWIFELLPKCERFTLRLVCRSWCEIVDGLPIENPTRRDAVELNRATIRCGSDNPLLDLIKNIDVRSPLLSTLTKQYIRVVMSFCGSSGRFRYIQTENRGPLINNLLLSLTRRNHPLIHAKNRDAITLAKAYMASEKCDEFLWNAGERDLALIMWDRRICSETTKQMFFYGSRKYRLDLSQCSWEKKYCDVVLKCKTTNPVKIIHKLAYERHDPHTREVAKKFCQRFPKVAELWDSLKKETIYDCSDEEVYIDPPCSSSDSDSSQSDTCGADNKKSRGSHRWQLQKRH
jgi:hypothetical protein